jgi:hypothetical protein
MIIQGVLLKKYELYVKKNGHFFLNRMILFLCKTKWALANRLGGVFTWDASLDDFNGLFCSEGIYSINLYFQY